jgi:hypothetical protein
MTKIFLILLGSLLSGSGTDTAFWASAARDTTQRATVTLYSTNKYQGKPPSCLVLQTGAPGSRSGSCDVRYGALYVGDDLDWFESSAEQRNRSVIKDLGLLNWDQAFKVPTVEPLPKLKPGEQRTITVDSSGADGADGAPGARGQDGADADGVVRSRPANDANRASVVRDTPSRPKRDGNPRIDPLFVKAIVGHMYVIHVVDDVRDFYALFRVEALERGDNCTISWRLVPAPDASANKQ